MRRHGGQPLLGALVQLALQPPALSVGRLHDPPARGRELLHAGSHVGLETSVSHCDPRRRRDRLDERGIVEHRAVMDQHRDRPGVAVDRRGRTAGARPASGNGRPASST